MSRLHVEKPVDSKIVVVGSLNMDLVAFAPRIPVGGCEPL
jgi:hypothetical protein